VTDSDTERPHTKDRTAASPGAARSPERGYSERATFQRGRRPAGAGHLRASDCRAARSAPALDGADVCETDVDRSDHPLEWMRSSAQGQDVVSLVNESALVGPKSVVALGTAVYQWADPDETPVSGECEPAVGNSADGLGVCTSSVGSHLESGTPRRRRPGRAGDDVGTVLSLVPAQQPKDISLSWRISTVGVPAPGQPTCTRGRRSRSGSAWRRTSRVTGASSPAPTNRNRRRLCKGFPSVQLK
jgi:hypothetical protein